VAAGVEEESAPVGAGVDPAAAAGPE
jgi:hypothetical protein